MSHASLLLVFLTGGASHDPLVRVGLKNPSADCLKIQAFVFTAYHALKAQTRAGIIAMHADVLTKVSIQHAWSTFASHFSAEAGGCGIKCFSFSVPKFIDFLANSRYQSFYGVCCRLPIDTDNQITLPPAAGGSQHARSSEDPLVSPSVSTSTVSIDVASSKNIPDI